MTVQVFDSQQLTTLISLGSVYARSPCEQRSALPGAAMQRFLLGLLVLAVSGCATFGGVRSAPNMSGETRLYSGRLEQAALAARNAVVSTPLRIHESRQPDSSTWYLIARGPSAEFVRVVCEQIDEQTVAVRVFARRRFVLDGGRDWQGTLFAQIGLELSPVESLPGPGAK